MDTIDKMKGDLALCLGPFRHELVRVDDLVMAYGVCRTRAKAFLVDQGAVSLTRYNRGLQLSGIRPLRLWAIRNADHWREAGPKARTLAYLGATEAEA